MKTIAGIVPTERGSSRRRMPLGR
ncbi:MAG: hypothetical protein ACP5GN_05315 [Fervidicoccaceae archaeon]